jgi:hypothetical protein
MPYTALTPPVRQSDDWSCSVASAAWMLHSLGIAEAYPALEAAMVQAGLVSPQHGLEVGSGGPLADWLGATFHLNTEHCFPVTWAWLLGVAGRCPIMIGSGALYHWVAVTDTDGTTLTLANPAPGYRGLGDTMTETQFNYWAPWACVWIAAEEANEVDCSAYINLLGYLQGDVATALQDALDSARAATTKAARTEALDAAQAALDTLKRGAA